MRFNQVLVQLRYFTFYNVINKRTPGLIRHNICCRKIQKKCKCIVKRCEFEHLRILSAVFKLARSLTLQLDNPVIFDFLNTVICSKTEDNAVQQQQNAFKHPCRLRQMIM